MKLVGFAMAHREVKEDGRLVVKMMRVPGAPRKSSKEY
jgi:hypothetical protein